MSNANHAKPEFFGSLVDRSPLHIMIQINEERIIILQALEIELDVEELYRQDFVICALINNFEWVRQWEVMQRTG